MSRSSDVPKFSRDHNLIRILELAPVLILSSIALATRSSSASFFLAKAVACSRVGMCTDRLDQEP
jgi:hypothetical protein